MRVGIGKCDDAVACCVLGELGEGFVEEGLVEDEPTWGEELVRGGGAVGDVDDVVIGADDVGGVGEEVVVYLVTGLAG